MHVYKTYISGLLVLEPKVFTDKRGYFFESFRKDFFNTGGLEYNFIQDNQSSSKRGVVRGLHYQLNPYSQTKLVRVLQGKVLDVALDLRKSSETFGKYFSVILSAENNKQFLIPKGFAHGFSVLSETATLFYKCDNYYEPNFERGINLLDKQLNIDWKINEKEMIVSEKDTLLLDLNKADINFT